MRSVFYKIISLFGLLICVVSRIIQIIIYHYLKWRGYKYEKNKNGFYQWNMTKGGETEYGNTNIKL